MHQAPLWWSVWRVKHPEEEMNGHESSSYLSGRDVITPYSTQPMFTPNNSLTLYQYDHLKYSGCRGSYHSAVNQKWPQHYGGPKQQAAWRQGCRVDIYFAENTHLGFTFTPQPLPSIPLSVFLDHFTATKACAMKNKPLPAETVFLLLSFLLLRSCYYCDLWALAWKILINYLRLKMCHAGNKLFRYMSASQIHCDIPSRGFSFLHWKNDLRVAHRLWEITLAAWGSLLPSFPLKKEAGVISGKIMINDRETTTLALGMGGIYFVIPHTFLTFQQGIRYITIYVKMNK